jgi:hypothetical protein
MGKLREMKWEGIVGEEIREWERMKVVGKLGRRVN